MFHIDILNTYRGVFFFSSPLFFANPFTVGWKAGCLCSGQNVMWAWVVVLVLEVVYWELFVQFWGGQPSAALHGIVAVLSAVSPACLQGQSVGRLRGSSGASQWVAVQKVILSAHNQVQCFALAPVLIPASDQAWRKSTSSVPYSVLLASLYFRKISGLDLNFLMCRVLIIMS